MFIVVYTIMILINKNNDLFVYACILRQHVTTISDQQEQQWAGSTDYKTKIKKSGMIVYSLECFIKMYVLALKKLITKKLKMA